MGSSYSLLGTTAWPGVEPPDVEFGNRDGLMTAYPNLRTATFVQRSSYKRVIEKGRVKPALFAFIAHGGKEVRLLQFRWIDRMPVMKVHSGFLWPAASTPDEMAGIQAPEFFSLQPAGEEPNKRGRKHPWLDPLLCLFLAIRFCLSERNDYARKHRDGNASTNEGEIVN
jgi:hypothetical protein